MKKWVKVVRILKLIRTSAASRILHRVTGYQESKHVNYCKDMGFFALLRRLMAVMNITLLFPFDKDNYQNPLLYTEIVCEEDFSTISQRWNNSVRESDG